MANHHGLAAFVADLIGRLGGFSLAAERSRVLADLGMILAGDERTKESAPRDKLPPAGRTALSLER